MTHVGTGVEEDLEVSKVYALHMGTHDGSLRGGLRISLVSSWQAQTHLDVRLHPLKVKADRLRVKVLVRLDLETRVLGDGNVVAPCWRRQVDGLGAGVVSGKEGSADAEGTGTGDGLSDGELASVCSRKSVGDRNARSDL